MNLEEDQVGSVLLGDYTEIKEGRRGAAHAAHHVRCRRRRPVGRWWMRSPSDRRQGPHSRPRSSTPVGAPGAPAWWRASPGEGTDADRTRPLDAMIPIAAASASDHSATAKRQDPHRLDTIINKRAAT